MAAESNSTGVFERSETCWNQDEHLISFKSDLEATYLIEGRGHPRSFRIFPRFTRCTSRSATR